jgi:imidazolonepropionase-like amidohydrolase
MRAILLSLLAVATAAATAAAAVPIPAPPQDSPIILQGGTVHTMTGPPLRNASVVIENGKIVQVGRNVVTPSGVRRIRVNGKHVYPGMIESHTRLGLLEIGAVRATRDYAEVGPVTPNVEARVAVNPESELIPVARANGVLLAVAAPEGQLIRGQASMMMLDGWTWEDMTLEPSVGLTIEWPSMVLPHGPGVKKKQKELERERRQKLDQIEQVFADAKAYWIAKKAAGERGIPEHRLDSRWEAMIPVFEGQLPIIVAASEIRQIQAAVAFASRHGAKLIIFGGTDAPSLAKLLRSRNVPVIVDGTLRLPARRADPYDAAYALPAKLYQAGIRFCISAGGNPYNDRNLPYHAAMAAAFGLPEEEALKAITLYPAQIFGVDDRVGSIEAGKDATLFVADGNIMEIPTQVEFAFIQGRQIELGNKQTVLYEKYREKYRRLGIME